MKDRLFKTMLTIINENNDLLNENEFQLVKSYFSKKGIEIVRKSFDEKDRNEIDKILNEIKAYLPIVSTFVNSKIKLDKDECELINGIEILKPFRRLIECPK
jgi:hypothetical protein